MLRVARIIVGFKICAFELGPVVSVSFLTLLRLDQLIVEILELVKVGNNAILVLLLTLLAESVIFDLKNL